MTRPGSSNGGQDRSEIGPSSARARAHADTRRNISLGVISVKLAAKWAVVDMFADTSPLSHGDHGTFDVIRSHPSSKWYGCSPFKGVRELGLQRDVFGTFRDAPNLRGVVNDRVPKTGGYRQ